MIRHSLRRNKNPLESQELDFIDAKKEAPKPDYSPSLYFFFLFFVLYMALPLIDVPLLGLSISAPIFFLIALPVFFRPPRPWMSKYRGWIFIAALIWIGLFTSTILNGLGSGGTRVDRDSWVALFQYAYWFLVFVVTVYLVSSQKNLVERLITIVAIGIASLGFIRLGEAVFGGAIGAWMHLQVMTQNGYGIQFSMFYPVLLSCVYWGSKRRLAMFATLALLAAILINGSRSNWLAALASTLVFLWMLLRTQRQRARVVVILFLLIGMLGLGALLAPQVVVTAFEERFSTFDKLEQDKSYAIRQLMIQKGVLLFKSSPWIGVGVARWRKEYIPLEIPRILSFYSQSYYDNKSSHNSYVSHLAESGLVGSVPLALLLLILLVRGYRSASRLAKRGQVWALGIYAGFIGMSIHLWSLSGLAGTVTWFVYALLAAVIALAEQIPPEEKKPPFHAARLSLSRSREE